MRNIPLYIDIVFCTIVFPMMVVIFPVERWFHNFPGYVISVGIWFYLLYAVNRWATVPYLFKGKRKATLALAFILLSIAVTYIFSQVTLYTPKPSIHDIGIDRLFPHIQQYQQAIWSLFMVTEAFSFAVGLLTQTNVQRARRRAVEAERDKAEIELYKAQIKPHFMFNTLNSLYGLFLTDNPNALPSLERFISMMRYIHTSSTRDIVPLREEADYIRQYVAIQTLRLNEMTEIFIDIDISDDSLMVPPMLLVTFVENCFKHGVSPVEHSIISISLKEHDGTLSFNTSNRIFPVKRIGEHIGIENCRKRLGQLFPGRHTISVGPEGDLFKVALNIHLS